MVRTERAVLLVVHVSGFPLFTRLPAMAGSHARQITLRLLKALVRAAKPPLRATAFRRDAVLFYAPATAENLDMVAAQIDDQVLQFFHVLEREIEALRQVTACVCDACTSVEALQLQQVIHAGEVQVHPAGRFEQLGGPEVDRALQMMEKAVAGAAYLMLSPQAYEAFGGFFALEPDRLHLELEGIGALDAHVYYRGRLWGLLQEFDGRTPQPSRIRTIAWKMKMHLTTLVHLADYRTAGRLASSAAGASSA